MRLTTILSGGVLLLLAPSILWAVPPGQATPCAINASAPTYIENTANNISCDLNGQLRITGSITTTPGSGTQHTDGTGTAGTPAGGVLSVQGVAGGTAQPVSAATLPLPSGAATSAKQPALGTAGTPSADVITMQGAAGMTPVKTTNIPDSTTDLGITGVVSSALESNHVLKASAGNLYGFIVTNDSTGPSGAYVMVFNATSAPGDGAVTPALCIAAPAPGQSLSYFTQVVPDVYSTGITVALSTTGCFAKTASAKAFFMGKVK